MPRLIPRLLRALDHARTRAPHEVDISPHGRTKSILLDRDALRLIYRHSRYQRHKTVAPQVHVSKARWKAKQMGGRVPLGALPREMTQEERSFYANPYLRMLGGPLRQCFQTRWLLPRDMLIRMTPMVVPDSTSEETKYVFLPSGLEHPAFTRHQGGHSSYLLCYKPLVDAVRQRGKPCECHSPASAEPT
ncbi:hypothetical protein GY45DRAFT_1240198 [Cubamyces sp. BRFM 1775]|nr:hypothetical protein GY45DRAFT_1240198 [Cubamyces sp. BRFM 1775]